MDEKEALERWLSNLEKQLEEEKPKLQDLKHNKMSDFERYEIYSSKIEGWLNEDDVNETVKESLEHDLRFLESEPDRIEREIKRIQNSIEHNEFVVKKLKQIINKD